MKRHGNLFSRVVAYDNIELAYRKARKGKAWQNVVRKFDRRRHIRLKKIRKDLVTRRFQTSPYKEKIIHEPKTRTIYILPFSPDRIVQHAVMNIVEPIWDNMFIYDSYACRKGKGLHAGSLRTMQFVRKYAYCLKCDISKFYPSIVHDILFRLVKWKIKCPGVLWIFEKIIYSIDGGKNVPIGNFTSQWLGNLCMHIVDLLVKQKLRIQGYLRYCDDFCLFHNSKKVLWECANQIQNFLWDRLQLTMSKCDVFPVSQGVDFLGYRHFQNKILLRKSTARRVKQRLARLPVRYALGEINMEQFRSSVASTMGWLKWANTHNLQIATQLDSLMSITHGHSEILGLCGRGETS